MLLPSLFGRARGYLLMSRPYSWLDSAAMLLLAKALVQGASFQIDLLFDGLVFAAILLLWFGFCWLLESAHRHPNRPPISFRVAAIAFAAGGLVAALINPVTIIFSGAYCFLAFLYSRKEASRFLGACSFVFRGAAQACGFAIAALCYSSLKPEFFLVGIAVGGVISSRSLSGDLRDVAFDKLTFPVAFGGFAASSVVSLLKLFASFLATSLFGSLYISFPLLAECALQVLSRNNYKLHKLYVIGSVVFLANMALSAAQLHSALLFTNLIYAGVLLSEISYHKIPRQSNPVLA